MRCCPSCQSCSLSRVALVRSSVRRPVRCGVCKHMYCLPAWFSAFFVPIFEIALWLGIVLSLVYQTALVFVVLFASAALACMLFVSVCGLRTVTPKTGLTFR